MLLVGFSSPFLSLCGARVESEDAHMLHNCFIIKSHLLSAWLLLIALPKRPAPVLHPPSQKRKGLFSRNHFHVPDHVVKRKRFRAPWLHIQILRIFYRPFYPLAPIVKYTVGSLEATGTSPEGLKLAGCPYVPLSGDYI